MEKKVSFAINNGDIIVEITTDDTPEHNQKCTIKNRSLNAKDIYDLLDYRSGDTYVYEEIQIDAKDKLVLEKLKEFFESITNQITGIVLSPNANEIEQKIAVIEDEFEDDL